MKLTYREVGATRAALLDGAELPAGYDHTRRHVRIGSDFAAAVEALARWEPQRGAGLKVRSSAGHADLGVRFSTGLGVGALRLWAPCEIVWIVEGPARFGFGFGTLDGHPESGEEAFLVSVGDGTALGEDARALGGFGPGGVPSGPAEGGVWFDVLAFSRPAKWWVKPGHGLARRLQHRVTDGYVRAMGRATP